MKIYLKYNFKVVCETLVREQFEKFNIPCSSINMGEVEILDAMAEEKRLH